MLKTRHFHFAVIFFILINTHLSEAYLCDRYDNVCRWSVVLIIFGIIITLVAFLSCIFGVPRIFLDCYNCIDESCVQLHTSTQNEPPFYHRNETVTINQAQHQATYDYESLPQPLPKFGLPEISNREWLNGRWVHQSNSETLPQPLPGAPARFSGPESEATCSTQNETTTSPKPILYSYTS